MNLPYKWPTGQKGTHRSSSPLGSSLASTTQGPPVLLPPRELAGQHRTGPTGPPPPLGSSLASTAQDPPVLLPPGELAGQHRTGPTGPPSPWGARWPAPHGSAWGCANCLPQSFFADGLSWRPKAMVVALHRFTGIRATTEGGGKANGSQRMNKLGPGSERHNDVRLVLEANADGGGARNDAQGDILQGDGRGGQNGQMEAASTNH
ncbi:unnamed protein product [Closterium sp. NIES-64]|nr:unnamed protein product [Closterium sp. NIES-64]